MPDAGSQLVSPSRCGGPGQPRSSSGACGQGLCQPQTPLLLMPGCPLLCGAPLQLAESPASLVTSHYLMDRLRAALACVNVTCAECHRRCRGGWLWLACRTESCLPSPRHSVAELLPCCTAAPRWPRSAAVLPFPFVPQMMGEKYLEESRAIPASPRPFWLLSSGRCGT